MENEYKIFHDIILLCKGKYHTNVYEDTFDAMRSYFHLSYCSTEEFTYCVAIRLFLNPTVEWILTAESWRIADFLDSLNISPIEQEESDYYGILFETIVKWIERIPIRYNTNGEDSDWTDDYAEIILPEHDENDIVI